MPISRKYQTSLDGGKAIAASTEMDPIEMTWSMEGFDSTQDLQNDDQNTLDLYSEIVAIKDRNGGRMSQSIIGDLESHIEGYQPPFPKGYYTALESNTLALETWDDALSKAKTAVKAAGGKLKRGIGALHGKAVEWSERNANSAKSVVRITKQIDVALGSIDDVVKELKINERSKVNDAIAKSITESKQGRALLDSVNAIVEGGTDFTELVRGLNDLDSAFLDGVKAIASGKDITEDTVEIGKLLDGFVTGSYTGEDNLNLTKISIDLHGVSKKYVSLSDKFGDLGWVTRDAVLDSIKEVSERLDEAELDDDVLKGYVDYSKYAKTYMTIRYRVLSDVSKLGEFLLRALTKELKMIGTDAAKAVLVDMNNVK